ncbi:TPA: antitoxin Xre/MbcA/ParS toxin-binding domain-containing protein [Vibrio parahaemolyticus]|uniref:MbcA/ParS/Xre antitoxin family protein n=1 Tax=Vibrio parahaemolyticus TaxID=670 RepID=UPI0023606873|nr:MbcA/ParS/Xre antitoxin family protein [Vibrio parahaemolyticus]
MSIKQLSEKERVEVKSVLLKFPVLQSEIEDVFRSEEMANEWLTSSVPALQGLTPIEVLQQGNVELVLDIVNRLKYGDFS